MPDTNVIFINRVYWPSVAATAQLLTDLAEGLALSGRPVQIIAAGEMAGIRNGVAIHRTGDGEKHGGLVSRARNYLRFVQHARRQLATMVKPGDVVVAMTDPPMLGAAIAGIAEKKGARVIHWIQDIYPEIVTAHVGPLAAIPLWPLQWARNRAWHSADRCVALGAEMGQAVAAQGVSPDRITIIPNWAPRELEAAPAPADVAAQRAAWGVADKFIVAYSGNLGRVHEFAAVIEAAALLKHRNEIVFLFIGSGARFDEVHAIARTTDLTNVRFLPAQPREKLAASLAAADAHLVTQKPDFATLVYPSKLAGVLAAGRPVLFVGPPDGEIARLLAKEQCGVAVCPTEGNRLAEAVAQWLGAPAQCAEAGRHARAAYEKTFTRVSALARWEEVLRQACLAG